MAVSPLLHAAFKCDGNLDLKKKNSFEMIGTIPTNNHAAPSRIFKDTWKFQLCQHLSNINFLVVETQKEIQQFQLFYIGKSAADVQLLIDTNNATSLLAATELAKDGAH